MKNPGADTPGSPSLFLYSLLSTFYSLRQPCPSKPNPSSAPTSCDFCISFQLSPLSSLAQRASRRIDGFNEQQILPDFLTDYFVTLLGYTRPADGGSRYTIGREEHVEVDGKYADAVLGDFNGAHRVVVALEGKGPRDPLDRPFAGRRMSAVDQGYRYAINLPCDWIIVTSMRWTRYNSTFWRCRLIDDPFRLRQRDTNCATSSSDQSCMNRNAEPIT